MREATPHPQSPGATLRGASCGLAAGLAALFAWNSIHAGPPQEPPGELPPLPPALEAAPGDAAPQAATTTADLARMRAAHPAAAPTYGDGVPPAAMPPGQLPPQMFGGGYAAGDLNLPPYGPHVEPAPVEHGLLEGFVEHLKDTALGRHEYFVEPPLGMMNARVIAMQRSRSIVGKYTLYRSDFLPGTDKLAPGGAERLNNMARRLDRWGGPIVVEWTPEDPALAENRSRRVRELLNNAGLAIAEDRFLVGPSGFRGLIGAEADNQLQTRTTRYIGGSPGFPLPPEFSSTLQGAGGGGGGGGGGGS